MAEITGIHTINSKQLIVRLISLFQAKIEFCNRTATNPSGRGFSASTTWADFSQI